MYQTVLREAGSEADLAEYLDEATLTAVWSDLHLPPFLRHVWQDTHPGLGSC
jgi:hypothetical protein